VPLSLSSTEIKNIVETLQESEWDQAVIVVGDVQISVARNGARLAGSTSSDIHPVVTPDAHETAPSRPTEALSTSALTPPATELPSHKTPPAVAGHVVEAPSVGVFWTSSEPGAAPFVSVGQTVQPGDTLCIIEIMKLMNNVTADVAGEVIAIHVANAAAVEYGTPLFSIRLTE